jgi:hypothetical protein
MAMLPVLRIGKEIYDETEEYLINHLLYRRQNSYQRMLTKCRRAFTRLISRILKVFGLDDFI